MNKCVEMYKQSYPIKTKKMNLTLEELSTIEEKKGIYKQEHMEYIKKHPELNQLISDYMSVLLMDQPENVFSYSKEYFTNLMNMKHAMRPLVIAGPSGVGKGTLIQKLMQKFPDTFGFSISHTTRKIRGNERDGVEYHFVKEHKDLKDIEFLEKADVHGNVYGTSKSAVLKVQESGKICILDIDVQGVEQVKSQKGLICNYVFIQPPDLNILEQRLRLRKTDSEESIQTRLENAKMEIEFSKVEGKFDKVIVNHSVEQAMLDLIATLSKWYTL